MIFNERLSEIRKARGYTQQSAADALMVERTRYSKWESGKSYPSIEMLMMICDLFDISADYLFGRIDEVKSFPIKKPAELADLNVEQVIKTDNETLTPDEVAAVRRIIEQNKR